MRPDFRSNQGPTLLGDQQPLLRRLLAEATYHWPTHNVILSQHVLSVLSGSDVNSFMHDGWILKALCGEATQHLTNKQYQGALAWGKVAYVAIRRFAHCWLPFIDIIVSSGVLPGYAPTSGSRNTTPLIPQSIVQFWDKPLPPADVLTLIDGWKRSFPTYKHLLFNDLTAREFISDCYDNQVLTIYDAIEHVAGKADLFRLVWLAKHGGIYVDADDRCIGDVGMLLPSEKGLVLNWSPGPPPCVNNWFVAARPDHPVIGIMVSGALDTLLRAAEKGLRLSPWVTTGPGLYSMVLMDEVALANGTPTSLSDLSFQRESDYRTVVEPVHDLTYRSDQALNWKLAYS